MISTTFVRTHEGFHNEIFMLTEDQRFMLCIGGKRTHVFTEEESQRLVTALSSFGLNVLIEKMKLGRKNIPEESKVMTLLFNASFDPLTYTIFRINVSTSPRNTWSGKIIMEDKTVDLPSGVIDFIFKHLLSTGAQYSKSYGLYDKIIFVDKLPESAVSANKEVYVLNRPFEDKPTDSAWVYDDMNNRWRKFFDQSYSV